MDWDQIASPCNYKPQWPSAVYACHTQPPGDESEDRTFPPKHVRYVFKYTACLITKELISYLVLLTLNVIACQRQYSSSLPRSAGVESCHWKRRVVSCLLPSLQGGRSASHFLSWGQFCHEHSLFLLNIMHHFPTVLLLPMLLFWDQRSPETKTGCYRRHELWFSSQ